MSWKQPSQKSICMFSQGKALKRTKEYHQWELEHRLVSMQIHNRTQMMKEAGSSFQMGTSERQRSAKTI